MSHQHPRSSHDSSPNPFQKVQNSLWEGQDGKTPSLQPILRQSPPGEVPSWKGLCLGVPEAQGAVPAHASSAFRGAVPQEPRVPGTWRSSGGLVPPRKSPQEQHLAFGKLSCPLLRGLQTAEMPAGSEFRERNHFSAWPIRWKCSPAGSEGCTPLNPGNVGCSGKAIK